MIMKWIATACVGIALFLDTMSYYRQIVKTIRSKHSSQVSSTAFLYKITKAIFAAVALVIFSNYIGLLMELFMICVYVVSLYVIAKYKPKDWKLFDHTIIDHFFK